MLTERLKHLWCQKGFLPATAPFRVQIILQMHTCLLPPLPLVESQFVCCFLDPFKVLTRQAEGRAAWKRVREGEKMFSCQTALMVSAINRKKPQ